MSAPTLHPHPLALLVPEMMRDEYVELVADIKAHGLHEPIVLFENKILDGRHRYNACVELGIEPTTENFTGTEADAKAYVVSLNVHRRHLTLEQKRRIVDTELRRDATQSDRAIAITAHLSPSTVGAVRKELEATGEVSKMDTRVGRNGIEQAATKPPRAPITFDAEAMHVADDGSPTPAVVVPMRPTSPQPAREPRQSQPFAAAATAGASIAQATDLFIKIIWRGVPAHARIALRAALVDLMDNLLRKEAGRQ